MGWHLNAAIVPFLVSIRPLVGIAIVTPLNQPKRNPYGPRSCLRQDK